MAGQPQREWTDNDQALLYTVHLVADLLADRPMRPAPVRTPFPPQYAREEQYLASSNFTLYSYRGLGDGSYMHDSSFFFATGSGGLAATAGFAAARALGNSRRRNQAARDAVARWLPRHTGEVTVSDHGVYFRNLQDFFAWHWGAIDSAEMMGFNQLVIAAPSTAGTMHWMLESLYAELVFALWAKARHPSHSQLVTGDWLPENWLRWATDMGQRPAIEA